MLREKKYYMLIPAFILVTALFLSGCTNNSVTNPNASDNVAMSTVSVIEPLPGDVNVVLQINEVKLMIKHLIIETEDEVNGKEQEMKIGPFVLNYNMTPAVSPIASLHASDAESYSKVKFLVHKLEGNETSPDPEFVDNQGRYSVIVKGTYDGVPFVYKCKISAVQKLYMPTALVVNNKIQNVTLRISPYQWFVKNGVYLDPRIPEDANEIDKNIKDNIKGEMKCFIDNDYNGVPD